MRKRNLRRAAQASGNGRNENTVASRQIGYTPDCIWSLSEVNEAFLKYIENLPNYRILLLMKLQVSVMEHLFL